VSPLSHTQVRFKLLSEFPVLPKAETSTDTHTHTHTHEMSVEQVRALRVEDERTLRKLRLFLRNVCTQLVKQFKVCVCVCVFVCVSVSYMWWGYMDMCMCARMNIMRE